MQTIFPILRYTNARAAIEWLCDALGFQVGFIVPEEGEFVRHAQLILGENRIMVGSVREDGLSTPNVLKASTQALYVYIPNLDEHNKRAQSKGVCITSPLQNTDFGAREYHIQDLEGHLWAFGSYQPNNV